MAGNYQKFYADHVRVMQQRWEVILEAESLDGLLVHSGSPICSFQDDYEYAFRPNPHFLAWLPLTHHANSVLFVQKGERPRLCYFQPNDYWHLAPSDPDNWWADSFDIEIVRDEGGWEAIAARLGVTSGAWAAIGDAPALFDRFEESSINPPALTHRLQLARTRKTPYELACMRGASWLAAKAHTAAEDAFRQGKSEYAIHMDYLAACQHTDAELPYNNIVALNEHGAVLHYQARNLQAPRENRSFLIDAGCTVNAYASDITRTYAAQSGLFADLVVAMDHMQLELISEVTAGSDYKQLHLTAHQRIAGILADAGIIRQAAAEAVDSGLSSVFFPHGLGHFIGLQTHDVAGLVDDQGNDIARPEGHPFLRLTRILEADNVLTIEPGLYIIDALLNEWRERNGDAAIDWDLVDQLRSFGGIRIEDNVVVTDAEPINLTRDAFASLSD